MRDAFYGGWTTPKANRSARIVVEGRKAHKRRVEERKMGPRLPSEARKREGWGKVDRSCLAS